MDNDRTHLLISELESTTLNEQYVISEEELRAISLQKLAKVRTLETPKMIVLWHVLEFIQSDSELVKVLSISKEANSKLKDKIY